MGNALGNMKEYWDEIYSHQRMLGGFIWEWADGGIMASKHGGEYAKVDKNGKMIAYGGDFGDNPNLKAFCVKGVITGDLGLMGDETFDTIKALFGIIDEFNASFKFQGYCPEEDIDQDFPF